MYLSQFLITVITWLVIQKEEKFMKNYILLITLSFLITFQVSAAPRDDAMNMVKEAAALVESKGADALKVIGKTNGKFHKGSQYVFVYDPSVTIVAHPVKPTLVGRSYKGKPDVKGKKFRDDIVNNTIAQGESWTDYVYQKPGKSGLFEKSAFCKLATHSDNKYIVCSGIYKEK